MSTIWVTLLSNEPSDIFKENCIICSRLPKEKVPCPYWNASYCKHHFTKLLWSEGNCQNRAWRVKLNRENYITEIKRKLREKIKLKEETKNSDRCISDDLSINKTNSNINEEKNLSSNKVNQNAEVSFERLLTFIDKKLKKFARLKNPKLSLIESQHQDEIGESVWNDKQSGWKTNLMELNLKSDENVNINIKNNEEIQNPYENNKPISVADSKNNIENNKDKNKNRIVYSFPYSKIFLMLILLILAAIFIFQVKNIIDFFYNPLEFYLRGNPKSSLSSLSCENYLMDQCLLNNNLNSYVCYPNFKINYQPSEEINTNPKGLYPYINISNSIVLLNIKNNTEDSAKIKNELSFTQNGYDYLRIKVWNSDDYNLKTRVFNHNTDLIWETIKNTTRGNLNFDNKNENNNSKQNNTNSTNTVIININTELKNTEDEEQHFTYSTFDILNWASNYLQSYSKAIDIN